MYMSLPDEFSYFLQFYCNIYNSELQMYGMPGNQGPSKQPFIQG